MKNKELYDSNILLLKDEDICLLSYPRSGNTWLRVCMADIYLQFQGYSTNTELPVDFGLIIPTLNKHNLEKVLPFKDDVRIFKSHKWSEAVARKHRIIYIYRNPLDVLRSYYRFYYKGDETNELMEFVREQAIRWDEHARKAIQHKIKNNKNICLLSYEELSTHGVESLLRVFDFIQLDASSYIEKALLNQSFDRQKKSAIDRKIPSASYNYGEGKVGLGLTMPKDVCDFILENTQDTYKELRELSN